MNQLIEVKNIATRLPDAALRPILAAVQAQANQDVQQHWDSASIEIALINASAAWTAGAWRFLVADTAAQVNQNAPGDLGDHDQEGCAPTGYAFVGPTLDANMQPSVTISHEILEMIGDPLIDQYCQWSDVPSALFLAQELCDPVEDDSLGYIKNGVLVSNFVLPGYFVPSSAGPWDFCKKLSAPNTLGTQSYQLRWDPTNGLSQYWGLGQAAGRASPAFASPYSRRVRRMTKAQQRSKLAHFTATAKPTTLQPSASTGQWALLTIALLVGLALCGVWITHSAWSHDGSAIRWQWLAVEAVLFAICVWSGYIVNRRPAGVLIDDNNRISLERTQWVAWFIVLIGGFFTESVWNMALSQPFPVMQSDLYILLGIVSGSAVTSNLITDAKKNTPSVPPPVDPQIGTPTQVGASDVNVSPVEASWADLYLGDEVATRNVVDISRLQKLVITILLVLTYVQLLLMQLGQYSQVIPKAKNLVDHFASMPQVSGTGQASDNSFLWLLGISHAAYLAYKATPKTPTTTSASASAT